MTLYKKHAKKKSDSHDTIQKTKTDKKTSDTNDTIS